LYTGIQVLFLPEPPCCAQEVSAGERRLEHGLEPQRGVSWVEFKTDLVVSDVTYREDSLMSGDGAMGDEYMNMRYYYLCLFKCVVAS
jgi:hypothetical protein